ncbi:hypothetical protein BC832DRAFT_260077 [Gaertneriomyces semiglobifer]|nr:hypothetical protein BC832DRAFT_260077 [Gaertneriomyces semiglobifer]
MRLPLLAACGYSKSCYQRACVESTTEPLTLHSLVYRLHKATAAIRLSFSAHRITWTLSYFSLCAIHTRMAAIAPVAFWERSAGATVIILVVLVIFWTAFKCAAFAALEAVDHVMRTVSRERPTFEAAATPTTTCHLRIEVTVRMALNLCIHCIGLFDLALLGFCLFQIHALAQCARKAHSPYQTT